MFHQIQSAAGRFRAWFGRLSPVWPRRRARLRFESGGRTPEDLRQTVQYAVIVNQIRSMQARR